HNFTGAKVMRDLTVDTTHTYYVLAGTTPVLVHNNDPGFINLGVSGGESCPVGRGANSWTPDSADGYPSYDKAGGWLQVHGPARNYATPGGPKLNWEHVVEQSQGKQGAGRSNFPQEWINNPDNMFLQDQSINFAKNGYYAKTFNWTGGKPIRDMLADMPFHQQWDFGMYVNRTLRTHGKSGLVGDV
ncbi:hypothetical protein LXN57_47610, partial [Actinoplanes sp. TRM88002]|nr:hypothetical protein [Actinoplanes hotanensis]